MASYSLPRPLAAPSFSAPDCPDLLRRLRGREPFPYFPSRRENPAPLIRAWMQIDMEAPR